MVFPTVEDGLEGLFAADAFFQGAGVEAQVAAHLRDAELNGAEAGGQGLGFEAVGVALAGVGALVGLGLQGFGSLLLHGFVDQQADAFGHAVGAIFSEQLQD